MSVQEATIGETRFKKVDQDVIERCDYRERYRRADNAHGYEFYSRSCARWIKGVSEGADKKRILDALDALLPRKVRPFGNLGWLPAGEGCVRATKAKMTGARYRRGVSGDLEFQNRCTKEWYKGYSNNECKDAIDHFWPTAPVALPDKVFTREDGNRIKWLKGSHPNTVRMYWCDAKNPEEIFTWKRNETNESFRPGLVEAIDFYWPPAPKTYVTAHGIMWRREGDELVSHLNERLRVVDGVLQVRHKDSSWLVTHGVHARATVEALAPEWLVGKPEALVTAGSLDVPEPIAWTFKVTPDKVDLPRILREAYAAGAREVTVDNNGTMTTYCQLNEYHTVITPWACKTCYVTATIQDDIPDGWCRLLKPYLEQARAWHKVQNTHKVVVKVSGVR